MKRLTALVKGISEFIRDYGVSPHIALMHPTTLNQLKREIEEMHPSMEYTHQVIKRTELKSDSHMAKDSIVFTMKDGAL